MIKRYLLALLVAIAADVHAQAQHRHKRSQAVVEPPPPPKIFVYVTQLPKFYNAPDVNSWLQSHIYYPEQARNNGDEGNVDVLFEIDKEGIVHTLSVKHSSGSKELDNEALRVINAMPRWNPAKYNGNPIPYVMMLPVHFRINHY